MAQVFSSEAKDQDGSESSGDLGDSFHTCVVGGWILLPSVVLPTEGTGVCPNHRGDTVHYEASLLSCCAYQCTGDTASAHQSLCRGHSRPGSELNYK